MIPDPGDPGARVPLSPAEVARRLGCSLRQTYRVYPYWYRPGKRRMYAFADELERFIRDRRLGKPSADSNR